MLLSIYIIKAKLKTHLVTLIIIEEESDIHCEINIIRTKT